MIRKAITNPLKTRVDRNPPRTVGKYSVLQYILEGSCCTNEQLIGIAKAPGARLEKRRPIKLVDLPTSLDPAIPPREQ